MIDETNNFESSNFLTITLVESPTITSITEYEVNGVMYAKIAGSGFMNSPTQKIYTLFSNGQLLEYDTISDTELHVPVPIQNPGSFIINFFVSIDMNSFYMHTLASPLEVQECIPDYCPGIKDTSFLCGPGYVPSFTDPFVCEPCSDGTDSKYCPFSGGSPID